MKASQLIIAFVLVITLSSLSACTPSKSAYESQVKAVLTEFRAQAGPLQTKLKTVSTGQRSTKTRKLLQQEADLLEQAKDGLDGIQPPDDFFVGHSDLIESLSLMSEAGRIEAEKDTSAIGDRLVSLVGAATKDYAGAIKELPFLEYELSRTFGDSLSIIQDLSLQAVPGAPSPRRGR